MAHACRTILVLLVAMGASRPVHAGQDYPPDVHRPSATEALQFLLDIGITPAGPIRADGSTIASILAGQSLTFPISTSSGAFAARKLYGFGPVLTVSTSGNFGSSFAERGITNGKGNASASVTYQRLSWGAIGPFSLNGGDLAFRRVQVKDMEEGPAATADEISARIRYTTDVVVTAASFGLLDRLDVGVSIPFVRAVVEGTKERSVRPPAGAWSMLYRQSVTGISEGIGDTVVRLKWRVPNVGPHREPAPREPSREASSPRGFYRGSAVALGIDVRMPTGKTDVLSLDCSAPPCGKNKLRVPDLGLGQAAARGSLMVSTSFARFSPHLNASYFYVSPYHCDEHRFGHGGRCKGVVFEVDPVNGGQDAKAQGLTDEIGGVAGIDFELMPYRATLSVDLLGRQLLRAGEMYLGPPRIIVRPNRPEQPLDEWASAEIETRHGNVNNLMAAIGTKIAVKPRWVLVGTVLLPISGNGLKPQFATVIGLERALGR